MDRLKLYTYILSIVVFVAVIWAIFFLKITVSDQVIPTLVNGITSSLSVIVGFSGAFIGIMFREIDKNDQKAKAFYLTAIILLFLPLTMLWTTYCFLAMNKLEWAVKYGLSGLIITLYLFFEIVLNTVKTLDAEAKKK